LIGLVIAPILGQEMPEATTPVIDEVTLKAEPLESINPASEAAEAKTVQEAREQADDVRKGAAKTARGVSSLDASDGIIFSFGILPSENGKFRKVVLLS